MKAKHGQVEVLISNEHLQEILWAAPHKLTTTATMPVNSGPETSLEGEATPEQLAKPDELFPLFIYFFFFLSFLLLLVFWSCVCVCVCVLRH